VKSPARARAWGLTIAAAACLLLALVPLDTLVSVGQRVSPAGAILDKTVLLLRALRVALPAMGALLIAWLALPQRWAIAVTERIHALIDSRWAPLAAVALGILVRIAWLWAFPTQPYADSQWYLDRAVLLWQGHGYVLDAGGATPTAAWPPGYPWLLSVLFGLTGPGQAVALALNVLLGGLAVWLTLLLGARWASQRIGVLASLAVALLPGLVVYTSLINSDLLFLCLTLGALTAASRPCTGRAFWWQALAIGVLLAAAALTRSLGLALLPVLAVAQLATSGRPRLGRSLLWALLAGLVMLLCIAPWTLRNYRALGKPVLISTNGGLNFWMGNNPGAGGAYHAPSDPDLNPLLAYLDDELALDEAGYRYGLAFMRANPRRVVTLWPAKVFYLYNSNDGGVYWNQRSAVRPLQFGTGPEAYWLTNLAYTLLLTLALLGAIPLLLRRQPPARWLPFVFVLWWTMLHLPFFGADRFALPALPMFAMLAASGLLFVLDRTAGDAAPAP